MPQNNLAIRRSFRLEKRAQLRRTSLSIPDCLPELVAVHIRATCLACQELLDIFYGSAECSACPLASFISRLKTG
jgi:hypothetical protein